jgi:hypothetical protein
LRRYPGKLLIVSGIDAARRSRLLDTLNVTSAVPCNVSCVIVTGRQTMSCYEGNIVPGREAERIDAFIDRWCARRSLLALREVLAAWPLNGLTDGWAAMLNALERVRATAGAGLDEQDREEVDSLTSDLKRIVYR